MYEFIFGKSEQDRAWMEMIVGKLGVGGTGQNNGENFRFLLKQHLGQILSAWTSSEKGRAVCVRETIWSKESLNPTTWVWVVAMLLTSCVLFSEWFHIAESLSANWRGSYLPLRDAARSKSEAKLAKVSTVLQNPLWTTVDSHGCYCKWVTIASLLLYFFKCISLEK